VTIKRVIGAVLILFTVYFPIAFYLKYSYVPEPARAAYNTAKFKPWPRSDPRTKAYIFDVPEYDQLADSGSNRSGSPLIVYENDRPLGPAHSGHESIQKDGHGRYSHWKSIGLIFSTSDNSDPNTNGNSYTVRVGQQ
jgi:hypothetical protein